MPVSYDYGTSLGFGWTSWWILWWVLAIWMIVCMRIVFKKAWRKWRESLIPIRNIWVLFKIAWKKNWFWFIFWPWIAWFIISICAYIIGISHWNSLWWTILNAINRVLGVISFIGCILFVIMLFKLAKKFWKSVWFGLWLWLLSPIFLWILAFDNSKYSA